MGKIVKYKMEMEVLTPVHIAGADYKSKLNKNEYIYKDRDKILILIDRDKFVDFLIKKDLFEEYLSYINGETKLKSLTDFLENNKISEEEFIKKIYDGVYIGKSNNIILLNRSIENKIYIPGSSIKGALVNLLLVNYIVGNRKEFENEIEYISSYITKQINKDMSNQKIEKTKDEVNENISNIIENIIQQILYKKDKIIIKKENKLIKQKFKIDEEKFNRNLGISISDTYKTENESFCFFRDFDEKLEEGNQVKKMPLAREYINPKTRFMFDITLDFELLSETRLEINDFNDLINALEEATNYLIKNILETPGDLDDLHCQNCQNLILGANTGFHQKTIVYALFENKKQRLEVVKRLLHKKKKQKKGDKRIDDHLDDRFSPRVINRIKIKDKKDNKLKSKLAGLVEIRKISEKEVGK